MPDATIRTINVNDLIREAVEAEREACAKLAETPPSLDGPTHGAWDRGYIDGRKAAAKDIRNRN
jgi:hypothetical protein